MGSYQFEKRLVLDYYNALEQAAPDAVPGALERFLGPDYAWRSNNAGRCWQPPRARCTSSLAAQVLGKRQLYNSYCRFLTRQVWRSHYARPPGVPPSG